MAETSGNLGLRERYGPWALVTGGSSGIGRAFARSLAAEGMSCLIVSDQAQELQATCDELVADHEVEAEALCLDLAEPDVVERIAGALGERELGLLVSNASFGRLAPFGSVVLEDYRRMTSVNVDVYMALSHAFLPAMLDRGRGGVVFVSSFNSLIPGVGQGAVYTATKAFETSLACGLWQETLGTGVDVLLVLPGPTRTRFQETAGTKVASWAMEPEEVVQGALPCLGRDLLHIAGQTNQLLAAAYERLTMDRRVELGSILFHAALSDGTL